MAKPVIEKGNMPHTIELEETDVQRLKRIAHLRGISDMQALREVLEEAEHDSLDEQAFDEGVKVAFRSPEIQVRLGNNLQEKHYYKSYVVKNNHTKRATLFNLMHHAYNFLIQYSKCPLDYTEFNTLFKKKQLQKFDSEEIWR